MKKNPPRMTVLYGVPNIMAEKNRRRRDNGGEEQKTYPENYAGGDDDALMQAVYAAPDAGSGEEAAPDRPQMLLVYAAPGFFKKQAEKEEPQIKEVYGAPGFFAKRRFCTECGSEVGEKDKYCRNCGVKLAKNGGDNTPGGGERPMLV